MAMQSFVQILGLCSLIRLALAAPTSLHARASNPVVDLGYSLHQGYLEPNAFGPAYYRFSNIQYATAPRFGLAQSPPVNRSVVQDGLTDIQCPQASPQWGNVVNAEVAGQQIPWTNITTADVTPLPAGTQEDCLFLDILVPEKVYANQAAKVPVLVYIHGGGYVSGSKAQDNPGASNGVGYEGEGYMTRSNGSVIFLALNYRLGTYGWFAGDSYQKNAHTNLGLRDQRFALEWVQQYISRFGGDPDNVLIFGESAGGGSVMNQMVAYGGAKGTPFKHVVPQSPWHQPLTTTKQEEVYQYALQVANVSTFAQLQKLDAEAFYQVNTVVLDNAYPFGLFSIQPVPDGDILPAYYTDLFNRGSFDRSLNVMVGHNANEGYLFTSPFVKTDAAYRQFLRDVLTDSSDATIDFIASVLYPPFYDGSQGYTTELGRLDLTVGDFSVNCNAELININLERFNGDRSSYAYTFTVPPGYHGEDVAFTMYAEGVSPSDTNATIAMRLQNNIINLAKTGNPNGPGLPHFPQFQPRGVQENFNTSGSTIVPIDNVNKRCSYWSQGLYRH